ncbi:MAG: hypothetical protein HS111_12340 [Kofleriaceae bacterium]|nr:hypothetical protein [Kofleriaceae bacterium]
MLRHANRQARRGGVAGDHRPARARAGAGGAGPLEASPRPATRGWSTPARRRAVRERVAARPPAALDRLEDELSASGVDLVRLDAQGSVVDPLLRFSRERQREGAAMSARCRLIVATVTVAAGVVGGRRRRVRATAVTGRRGCRAWPAADHASRARSRREHGQVRPSVVAGRAAGCKR